MVYFVEPAGTQFLLPSRAGNSRDLDQAVDVCYLSKHLLNVSCTGTVANSHSATVSAACQHCIAFVVVSTS